MGFYRYDQMVVASLADWLMGTILQLGIHGNRPEQNLPQRTHR